jgi:hypothetical protein
MKRMNEHQTMMKVSNERTGGLFPILGFLMILAAGVFSAGGQTGELIEISDGRGDSQSAPLTPSENQLIVKEVRAKESLIREKSGQDCEEDEMFSLSVSGWTTGSFTKPNVRQKAYLYELCRSTLTFGIGGIVIVENGRTVAHYVYGENGLDSDIAALPDINRNGFSEILMMAGGSGQGYTQRAIEIIEFTPGGIKSFGIADIYEDNLGTEDARKSAKAYKISVRPGKTPVYFRETFTRRGGAGKWLPAGRSEKYSLRRDYVPKFHKIS